MGVIFFSQTTIATTTQHHRAKHSTNRTKLIPFIPPVEPPEKVTLPNYDELESDELIINGWYTPTLSKESFQTYKDCGFNYIFIQGEVNGYVTMSNATIKALELCDELGLKAIVTIDRPEHAIIYAETFVQYESFVGFNYDEPVVYTNTLNGRLGFYELEPLVTALEEAYPQVEFMVNLNPSTAMSRNWGGQNDPNITYAEHLQAFEDYLGGIYANKEVRNWLSCDDYLLRKKPSTGENYLRKTWLDNLEILAERKRDSEHNFTTNFFIQSQPFSPNNLRVPTYNDLRMQVYSLMAFGYDSISYYCYATPPYEDTVAVPCDALIDRAGNKTQIWYDAQKINLEAKKLEKVYGQFKDNWIGTTQICGTNNTSKDANYKNDSFTLNHPVAINNLSGVDTITCTEDIIVGYLKDNSGNPGYVVVNYNDTTYNKTSQVEIKFDQADKALVFIDGEKQDLTLTDNILNLDLDLGEGVFVIPYSEN